VREIATEALELLDRGEEFALVRVISDKGSTPRAAGAEMIVRRDGSIAGTVGGGLIEATMMKEAAEAIARRRSTTTVFSLTGTDLASGEKMVCGGAAEVLIVYVEGGRTDLRDVCRAVADIAEGGGRAWCLTTVPLAEGDEVGFCLLHEDGRVAGSPPADVDQLRAAVGEATRHGSAVLPDGRPLVVEAIEPASTVFIFGAGHVGAALAPACSAVGFRVAVVDDRVEFASRERFPSADELIVPDSYEVAFEGLRIGGRSFVVIVTRGHTHDFSVLRQSLRTSAAYIGLMASTTKRRRFYDALREDGLGEAEIDRVHSPVGLSIGAETPAELAVSIVAEMIAVRAALPSDVAAAL